MARNCLEDRTPSKKKKLRKQVLTKQNKVQWIEKKGLNLLQRNDVKLAKNLISKKKKKKKKKIRRIVVFVRNLFNQM